MGTRTTNPTGSAFMSEPTTDTPTPEAPAPSAPEADKAADKDWQAEAEKWRSHAQKHEALWKAAGAKSPDAAAAAAEVNEWRKKASQFDESEESKKTKLQKAADERDKAKAESASTTAELARVRAAVKHGLSEDDLELLGTHGTPEEIDARAEKLAARIKGAEANKPRPDFGGGDRGTDVPGSGTASLDSQIAEATKAGNHLLAINLKQQRSALLAEKKKS